MAGLRRNEVDNPLDAFVGTRALSVSATQFSGRKHPIQKVTSWSILNCSKSSEAITLGPRTSLCNESNSAPNNGKPMIITAARAIFRI